MKKNYTIGQAAELVGLTSETIRHYDRIGLVKPHEKDKFTKYRYYTDEEIVALKTVNLLRQMGLGLPKIKQLLEKENLGEVVGILQEAEISAYREIRQIKDAIKGIKKARLVYEETLSSMERNEPLRVFERRCPQRILFVSDEEDEPSLSNLWQYHTYFYKKIPREYHAEFSFQEVAGLYTQAGKNYLCAFCERYRANCPQIKKLPSGTYLCCVSKKETLSTALGLLKAEVESRGSAFPDRSLAIIRVCGLLKWEYELQICLSPEPNQTSSSADR